VDDPAFSPEEIDDLAQKLADIQQQLTPRERQLLRAVFAAAADNVQRVSSAEVMPTTDAPGDVVREEFTAQELEDQLSGSFTPATFSAEADTHAKHPLKIVGR